jgi:type II restriction/modification system DNA methylase subunit YeeA
MNKARLKTYAPQARRDFMQMIRQRADLLGLTKPAITPAHVEGDFAIIEGGPYPKRYADLHKKITEKIKIEGLDQFIEHVAYSWFNRFSALRFMEINGFFSHGFRVLSNREASKTEPEILTYAMEIELPGLDKKKMLDLKLAGNRDAELYRMLLIAQCNELNRAMPFLFERINDETEILLPDNLLATDSVIRKMVVAIDEEDWAEVEIIGWLYQFYISEKKDEVIGKTVKSEDIPAATQLFTPNWIVKYMVQNSLGRLWLENNPQSPLKSRAPMEFYIEPAETADEEDRMLKNSSFKPFFHPGNIKILDPACGSGHILVEAYDLLKAIYTETGFSAREIPAQILKDNLFGLDIDERASQMTSFALIMKARRDDRRIFEKAIVPNVMAIPDSSLLEYTSAEIADLLADPSSDAEIVRKVEAYSPGALHNAVIRLLEEFKQGKTLGSLIRVTDDLPFSETDVLVGELRERGNLIEQTAAKAIEPFMSAAKMLAQKYDCVIANPPYMGGKYFNAELKKFAARNFPDSKADLFAMFIERGFELLKRDGFISMVTMQSWMFLSSFEILREKILSEKTITDLTQIGYNSFPSLNSKIAQAVVFTALNKRLSSHRGIYVNLNDAPQSADKEAVFKKSPRNFVVNQEDFKRIPGNPIAYWVSDKVREVFAKGTPLGEISAPRQGMASSDDGRFVRMWFEINSHRMRLNIASHEEALTSKAKWFPYNKGGEFRKWYGNNEHVVNWENDGEEVLGYAAKLYGSPTRTIKNISQYFKSGVTWTAISSGAFSTRFTDKGFIFSNGGMKLFHNFDFQLKRFLSFLNSNLNLYLISCLSQTLNFDQGIIARLPFLQNAFSSIQSEVDEIVEEAVSIARLDWDSFETSWDFKRLPIVDCALRNETNSVEVCWKNWKNLCDERITRMQFLETENNRLFIEAYDLSDELSPEVPLEQITLARADAEKDTRRLLSYFIGCLMGRYSLEETGLIYADAGGKGFAPARYQTFPADDDGIVPVTDIEWFPQEAARQFEKFVLAVWGEANQAANLRWIAEQLGGKQSETPTETVRRYFSQSFFKDHLQIYKKRPIYWLFSSGKQKAFECLVYLHRYSEATLPRMRHEYVLPLMSKLTAQIENLERARDAAQTSSERTKIEKQLEAFRKKQIELAQFDDKLRHYSDMRIALDLDEGVKVNYSKFDDLLAEVKQVAATKE